MPSRSETARRAALGFIALVTAWRVGMLWANGTDLFVDEAQYWAWGQHLDWGYFSKPPLIGWLLRVVTDMAGSDAPAVVRLAAPLLHGATAVTVIWAARAYVDGWVAAWAGALYVAMPLVSIGSSLISTDTVMLPFFALAIGLYGRLVAQPGLGRALLLGAAIGAGLMAKYAMVYFILCAGLVSVLQPTQRLRAQDAAVALGAALVVFAPNIWWNIANDGQTVRHVVEDNAQLGSFALNWTGALQFLVEQSVALGPILFVALFWPLLRRARGAELTLLLFCVPIIGIVAGQALLSRAFGNWAATAYIAAPILAASVLQMRRPLLVISQALNLAIAIALPLALAAPGALRAPSGEPLLARYLGLHAVSVQAAAEARAAGLTTLSAGNRPLMADFFYTLDGEGFTLRTWTTPDRPTRSWYHVAFPIERPLPVPVAFLGTRAPCNGAERLADIDPGFGHWAGHGLALWKLPAGC